MGVTLLNSCIALIALYISYIISYEATSSEAACALFSAIFHYIFLVSAFAVALMAFLKLKEPPKKWMFTTIIALNWGKWFNLLALTV